MPEEATFDAEAVHRHYAKTCFNDAWILIEKPDRTPEEDEEMIRLNQASLWHWTQRGDCTERNLAVGYWQASRIRSILGHGVEALRYAQLCLDRSGSLAPFFQASAHEGMARAAFVSGDAATGKAHAMQARVLAQGIARDEDRELVLTDLQSLPQSLAPN